MPIGWMTFRRRCPRCGKDIPNYKRKCEMCGLRIRNLNGGVVARV